MFIVMNITIWRPDLGYGVVELALGEVNGGELETECRAQTEQSTL